MSAEPRPDLARQTARGGIRTVGAQGARLLLTFAATVVLARLLTPSDYGRFGMAAAVIAFFRLFSDFGFSFATVQSPAVTEGQLSGLHWLQLGIGALLTAVGVALAPLAGWFFGDPELPAVMVALSAVFILQSISTQRRALLQRELRFGALAVIDVAAQLLGFLAALLAALLGLGYWALVLMPLVAQATIAAGTRLAVRWRPRHPPRLKEIKAMVRYGGNLTGFNVVNYFARQLDDILIGWYWGAAALGLYQRAYSLLVLPLQQVNAPIMSVAVPVLSRLQENGERFARFYLAGLKLVAWATMPVGVGTVIVAEPLIVFLLGEPWRPAARIFRIFGVMVLVQPVCNTVGWLYLSLGRTDRMLRYGSVACTAIVVAIACGLPFGPDGVAVSYTAIILLLAWPCLAYATRGTPVSVRDILKAVAAPASASLLGGAGALLLLRVAAPGHALGTVLLAAAGMLPVVAAAFLLSGDQKLLRVVRGAPPSGAAGAE